MLIDVCGELAACAAVAVLLPDLMPLPEATAP